VIDTSEYEEKDGNKKKNQRRLLPVKQSMIPQFERMFHRKNTFRGMMVELHRDGAKDAQIGNHAEFKGFVSEEQLAKFGDRAKPIDYEKYFKPKTEKELKALYGTGSAPVGSQDASDDEVGDVNWGDESGSDTSPQIDASE
jgi:hypothetical protein